MRLFTTVNKFAFSAIKASPLTTQLQANPNRNAIRFENQNRTWTFQELEAHSNAFAYGLVELGWKAGDKLLLWVESNHTSEIATAQIGAAKSGVTLVNCYAKSAEELAVALNDSKATGILFSPNSKAGNNKYIDIINTTIPELSNSITIQQIVQIISTKQSKAESTTICYMFILQFTSLSQLFSNISCSFLLASKGSLIKSKFPNLKQVIHTGFYSFPGTNKFRQVLVYASKNFNTLTLPNIELNAPLLKTQSRTFSLQELISGIKQSLSGITVNQDTSVFVTGDSRTPLSFQLGVLNSLVNGNYSVYTGAQDLNQVNQTLRFYNKPLLLVGDQLQIGDNIKNNSAQFAGVLSGANVQQLTSLKTSV